MINIVEDELTAEQFLELYYSVDWYGLYKPQVENLLKKSIKTFTMFVDDRLVGMGRLSKNRTSNIVYLKDFVIKSEYQGEGNGKVLMDYVLKTVHNNKPPEKIARLEVYSALGKESFYQKCGFKRSDNEFSGQGYYMMVE